MLSQIQPLKPPEKVNSWGTPFQTTCSLIPSLSQHGPAAWSRAVRATFPLWAPPRKGKLPCNGLVCLAGIWCHHCPRDEARAAQLCVTGCLYPSGNGTALFTSWVRGLWSKEAVSHSCWLGCAWKPRVIRDNPSHYQHYSGCASSWLQQIKFSQCPVYNL